MKEALIVAVTLAANIYFTSGTHVHCTCPMVQDPVCLLGHHVFTNECVLQCNHFGFTNIAETVNLSQCMNAADTFVYKDFYSLDVLCQSEGGDMTPGSGQKPNDITQSCTFKRTSHSYSIILAIFSITEIALTLLLKFILSKNGQAYDISC